MPERKRFFSIEAFPYHKLSEIVWVWGCGATRSEIWTGVTIAGRQTTKQRKIGLLSQWTTEGWDEQNTQGFLMAMATMVAALKWRIWQTLPDWHRLPSARTALPEVCIGPIVPGAKSHQFRLLRNQISINVCILSECLALEKPIILKCMYSLWVSGTW